MKKRDFETSFGKRIEEILKEYDCNRYLIFVGVGGKTGLFYKANSENDLVQLILLAILENLKDKPQSQEFLRTALLSAITGDAYGTGWWDRLKKVVEEIDQKGPKWFGRA